MSEITRNGEGTAMFTPPASYSADIYNLANQGPIQASRRTVEPFNAKDFSMWPTNKERTEWAWSWTIRDIAGLNLTRGEIANTYNRAASSNADTTFFQEGTLPLAITEYTPALLVSPLSYNIQGANVFGRQFIAIIGAALPALMAETSSIDPTLVPIATAGDVTNSLTGIYEVEARNGATIDKFLALCKAAQPIQLLNSSAGAVFGTMNAATSGAYGIVTTSYGNVIKAANSYWYLPNTSAYNAAPTEYNSGAVAAGGWAMGMKGVGNRPVRVYFNVPAAGATNVAQPGTSTSLSSLAGTLYKGHVESTNIYGYDRQQFDMPGLRDVNQSCFFRDGVIGTDGDNITFMGRVERHIVPFPDRVADSDRYRRIVGLRPKGHELFWDVEEITATGAATVDSRFWVERYDWDTDLVTQVTPAISRATVTGLQAYRALGAQVVSDQTGNFHGRLGPNTTLATPESWRYWRPESGRSVYGTRKTPGSTATGYPFHNATEANPITITLPETLFPAPITWARKTVRGYYYGGELQFGQGCQVACSNAPTTRWDTPASGTIKDASRWHPVNRSNAGFLLPQPVITFWAGSSLYSSPQVFPLTIQGFAYTDEHALGWRDGA